MKQISGRVQNIFKAETILPLLGIFYLVSMLITRTASWYSYGAVWRDDHPGFFHFEEIMAVAGAEYLIRFLLSAPLIYLIFFKFKTQYRARIISCHLAALPIFAVLNYICMLGIQSYFGWASVRVGFSGAWEVYENACFYFLQFGILHAFVFFRNTSSKDKSSAYKKPHTAYKESLVLQKGSRRPLIKSENILCLQANGDYCKVITATDTYLSPKGISETLKELNPAVFMRVHRSYAVNKKAVIEVKKSGRYHELVLSSGLAVRIGETYLEAVKTVISYTATASSDY